MGLSVGSATTAYIAGQADWWIWFSIGVFVAIGEGVRKFIDEEKRK